MSESIVAIDTGGTFTDAVTSDGRAQKVLSDPKDPVSAVRRVLNACRPNGALEVLSHGTTVATNALLERRGGKVALVTNEGFAHAIEIGRQKRPHLYDFFADRPEPLVERDLRFEVRCRLGPSGEVITELETEELQRLERALTATSRSQNIDCVAVSLLHSYANPRHEIRIGEFLRDHGFDVSLSCDICPEFREFERTSTTVINAYLRTVTARYLEQIGDLARRVLVMNSAGGLLPAGEAAAMPAWLLLSGPVAGAMAGAAAAEACGFQSAVTLDMGGTSADVALVERGRPRTTYLLEVGGFPVKLASVEIVTIGAGGGSIAFIDSGGALRVGPQSAGADPGPACYRRGGDRPTVTDADLVLGRIPIDTAFSDLEGLDLDAATTAIERLGVSAHDIVAVVDAAMELAIKKVTARRGIDPSTLPLVAFGGAGPLHACSLADSLGMSTVIVPPLAGVFSAVGLLLSPPRRDLVAAWPTPLEHEGLKEFRHSLENEAASLVREAGFLVSHVESSLDCRYLGQSWELDAPDVDRFHEVHLRLNGYSDLSRPVEVIAVRAAAWASPFVTLQELVDASSIERVGLVQGPRALAEADCSIFVPEGWTARVGPGGCWIIRRLDSGA